MRRLLGVLAGLALLLPSSAHAATRDVTLTGVQFDPSVIHADAGDTIRWTVGNGSHTITAYNGASFNHSFVTSGEVRTAPFNGGTALYRCEFHSSLHPLTLVCDGMCGAITDRTAAPASPAITTPAHNAQIPSGTVRVEGTAEPQTTVVVTENGNERGRAVANPSGVWKVDAQFTQGSHTIVARATDVEGRIGPDSLPRSFAVTGDTSPPTTTITTPSPAVFVLAEPQISGRASDDNIVAYVEVEIDRAVGPTRIVRAQCVGCFGPEASWFLRGEMDLGQATVRARAVDGFGNVGDWSESIEVVNAFVRP